MPDGMLDVTKPLKQTANQRPWKMGLNCPEKGSRVTIPNFQGRTLSFREGSSQVRCQKFISPLFCLTFRSSCDRGVCIETLGDSFREVAAWRDVIDGKFGEVSNFGYSTHRFWCKWFGAIATSTSWFSWFSWVSETIESINKNTASEPL